MTVLSFVIEANGKPVFADEYDEESWEQLKTTYAIGDFLTPCCKSPAIPKTSSQFLRFFAHHSAECTTSPESVWHISAKTVVVTHLARMGLQAQMERPFKGATGRLTSDIYFEASGRKVAIEIQHSYQTYAEYRRRQKKYRTLGIENYWLLFHPRFKTISETIAKKQIMSEFKGIFPEAMPVGSDAELPLAVLDTLQEPNRVRGPGGLNVSVGDWLSGVIGGAFRYSNRTWQIVDLEAL